MEINLTMEQEAQLFHLAALEGKNADEVARDVLLRGLQIEAALVASQSGSNGGRKPLPICWNYATATCFRKV